MMRIPAILDNEIFLKHPAREKKSEKISSGSRFFFQSAFLNDPVIKFLPENISQSISRTAQNVSLT